MIAAVIFIAFSTFLFAYFAGVYNGRAGVLREWNDDLRDRREEP